MADRLPINFDIPQEGAVASYDWTDIADGTGYITLYVSGDSAGHRLVTKEYHSHKGAETYYVNATATLNCDLTPFNSPRVIRGTAFIEAITYTSWGTSGSVSKTCQFYKVSNAVETSLGSAVSLSSTKDTVVRNLISLSLTQTNFKKGDILRLKIVTTISNGSQYLGTNTNGNASTVWIPSETYPFVPFKIQVPFKIDL
jgi:hypothetical protein